ncbi:MAG: family 20 glycosylhydrolase [Planctomycetota bacterium]
MISLEEFRELEAYAVVRGVTIIPELEVPGHSGKLCSLYPEVFGKNSTELATSETALTGIKTLLDELMGVFTSTPYIHIGGDEAFGVPQVAQRDLINKLHAYLKSKGRQTIVWEGPHAGEGENKVNTEVIHVNWRTINYPADQMLQDGYRVVNAAWDPLYIVDHYPRINFTMTSPRHVYEKLKLTRFKHVNPGIQTFANPIDVETTDRLIGFCMPWWEGREENFFPQIVPRLIPFAEVAWNPSAQRDYEAFADRVATAESTRRSAFYPVVIQASELALPSDGVFHNQTEIRFDLTRPEGDAEVRYTLDGTAPTASSPRYSTPIKLEESKVVRAAAFGSGNQIGHGSRLKLTCVRPTGNLALGKPVVSTASSASPFSVDRLTDGGEGNLDFYLGYPAEPEPIRVTVDLEQVQRIDRVIVHAYSISNSAERYSVELSVDGKTFEKVGEQLERSTQPSRSSPNAAVSVEHTFDPREARYVRVVTNGNKGYVFDSFSKLVEIQVFAAPAETAKTLEPEPIDFSKLAFYPERWKRAGQDFNMLAWEGENVVFVTKRGEYDPMLMTKFVERLDSGWKSYSDLIGVQPRRLKSFHGKPTICALPKSDLSCGYGCGYVGATGIEASAFYNIDLPEFEKHRDSFRHYYFYEMGRNFFVFGDRHSLFTTGYAVFMRYVCMDQQQCRDTDSQTRQTIEECEAVFARSDLDFYEAFTNLGSGEKSNRLKDAKGRSIQPSDQPVMYATAMMKLRREFGGDEWVKRFFHTLRKCEPVPAKDLNSAQTQIFNWVVSASIAAKRDLAPIFVGRWRMPMNEAQRQIMQQTDWTATPDVRRVVDGLVAAGNTEPTTK